MGWRNAFDVHDWRRAQCRSDVSAAGRVDELGGRGATDPRADLVPLTLGISDWLRARSGVPGDLDTTRVTRATGRDPRRG